MPGTASPGRRPAPDRVAPWERWAVAGAAAFAALPVLVATARALAREWLPVGDNAMLYARSLDVLSSHPPLIYLWSFSSTASTEDFNHPGPLHLDLYAVPAHVWGGAGLAWTTAAVNVACIVAIAVFARRRGGALGATLAMATTAVLCWSVGSRLLYDPWPPNSMVLPLLLFLVLAWSVADGDLVALPIAALVGTLPVQTNLSYGLLVPLVGAWAVTALLLDLRRQRRDDPAAWPGTRRRARRLAIAAVGVLVLCWVQPVIEQLSAGSDGNLSRIARNVGDARELGLTDGIRLFSEVSMPPTWWVRGSLGSAYTSLPSAPFAFGAVAVLAGLLGLAAWDARRRGDRSTLMLVATAAATSAVAVLTVARAPLQLFGSLSGYQSRLLWPVAAFLSLAVITAVARRLTGDGTRWPAVPWAVAAVVAVVALVNLWPSPNYGSHEPDATIPVMRELQGQLDGLEDRGTVLFAWPHGDFINQFYASGTIAELARRDIPYLVEEDDDFMRRMLGDHRAGSEADADAVVTVRFGTAAEDPPRGEERVAYHAGLLPEERDELRSLEDELRADLEAGRLVLNEEGVRALRNLSRVTGGSAPERPGDLQALLESGALLRLYNEDFLRAEGEAAPRMLRWAQLRTRWDEMTVAVVVRPAG